MIKAKIIDITRGDSQMTPGLSNGKGSLEHRFGMRNPVSQALGARGCQNPGGYWLYQTQSEPASEVIKSKGSADSFLLCLQIWAWRQTTLDIRAWPKKMQHLDKKSKSTLISGCFMGSEKTSSFFSLKNFLPALKTHIKGIVLHVPDASSLSNNSLFALKQKIYQEV